MSFLAWLRPGNDHQLAAEQYPGRESATARAARKQRERDERAAKARRVSHHRTGATRAARAGQKWSAAQR